MKHILVDLAEQWAPLVNDMATHNPTVLEVNHTHKKLRHSVWGYDTCATLHLTGDESLLTNVREAPPTEVRVANGTTMMATKIGTATLHIQTKKGNYETLVLKEVFVVPSSKRNLISAGTLAEEGYTATVNSKYTKVFNENGTLAGKFKKRNNIYIGKALKHAASH